MEASGRDTLATLHVSNAMVPKTQGRSPTSEAISRPSVTSHHRTAEVLKVGNECDNQRLAVTEKCCIRVAVVVVSRNYRKESLHYSCQTNGSNAFE